MSSQPRALAMRGIAKRFGGAVALQDVDFDAAPGEIHALLGMNGAGKSTLVQVLSGAIRADAGSVQLGDTHLHHAGPRGAREAGISTVYQKRTLVPSLSVAENIFLGELPRRSGAVDWRRVVEGAREALSDLGIDIDPRTRVDRLGPGQQTLVEIAREVRRGGDVIILDEPTASLGGADAALIHDLVRRLAERKRAVVYISHHLEEVMQLSDRVTVLRDGEVALTSPTSSLTMRDLVEAMVGSDVVVERPSRPRRERRPMLTITGLAVRGVLEPLDITVGAGEIVAVLGPAGDGQTALFRHLSGLAPADAGTVTLDGDRVDPRRIARTLQQGLRSVSGDRLGSGLNPLATVNENIAALAPVSRRRLISWSRIRREALELRQRFDVVTLHADPPVTSLSGGNQQKVLLAKWLSGEGLRACLLEEPTGGVDVRAKADIHELIEAMAADGVAVLLASSDVDEVLRLADRVIVLRGGVVIDEHDADDANHHDINHALLGGIS
ncbi:sugar ABC transporter ATP-binding protein [Aeromicrobium sp. Leaf350]|uniref:sugar ABC transporter ATP-binding protein n=1 Tax=Aeromicrobium sp. Leaf350 TaxID=2876565 RepID=UPI001E4E646B|nr:sugar ABC transporter ATP-binding protein [Aeromicrobium sp. Leaf350]